jgi:hypothetical protein
MKNFLECKRIPLRSIPYTAKVLCIVRHPLSRFISGFITLRKMGLLKIYETRNVSPQFKKIFLNGLLIDAFNATVDEIESRGPFDTHLQLQKTFLGPSQTIQNEFAGSRNPSKVTHWVPLEYLNEFCQKTFHSVPPSMNTSNKSQDHVIKAHMKLNPNISERILKIYDADAQKYFNILSQYK